MRGCEVGGLKTGLFFELLGFERGFIFASTSQVVGM